MITSEMVKHIQGTLNGLTKGKNTNFGQDLDAETAPGSGILVVLTDGKDVESLSNSVGKKVLASSTVLGKNDDIFTVEDKTINVINIPYSETISINTGTAKGFAIVQVEQGDLTKKSITGKGANADLREKYIIKAGSDANVSNYKIIFSGSISGD